jgi:2-polyprenyl-6-methoxyphenol hydroxylase-like FAD-dependent oxidoreductase
MANTRRSREQIVIVGAGTAGFATARSYRESGGRQAIALVAEAPSPPYERPLPTKNRGSAAAGFPSGASHCASGP